ncbi:MAG: hypothetical protein PHE27_06625 [Alphaproteobacteria bacterium]|nr:hypothetical protein [Alphaproteobacteria bacterium]
MFEPVDDLNTGQEERAFNLLLSASSGSSLLRSKLKEQLNARGEKQAILAQSARDARKRSGDDYLIVRASIEFSNYCRQICSYCGMAATNATLKRYRLNANQMCKIVKEVSSLGVCGTFVEKRHQGALIL